MNVHEHLCYADPRNPLFEDIHGGQEPDDIPKPREGCSCDNCYSGKDELALEIIALQALDIYKHVLTIPAEIQRAIERAECPDFAAEFWQERYERMRRLYYQATDTNRKENAL